MIWIDVVGYEGLYKINKSGEIKSINHYIKNGKGQYLNKGKILSPRVNASGYLTVRLSKNGIVKNEFIHVMVAKAFIPNPKEHKEVNHKDENKLNCKVENLEWCDRKYNATYSLGKQVINLNTGKIYPSLSSVEDDGYRWQLVSAVCRGKRKTHKNERWAYYEFMD